MPIRGSTSSAGRGSRGHEPAWCDPNPELGKCLGVLLREEVQLLVHRVAGAVGPRVAGAASRCIADLVCGDGRYVGARNNDNAQDTPDAPDRPRHWQLLIPVNDLNKLDLPHTRTGPKPAPERLIDLRWSLPVRLLADVGTRSSPRPKRLRLSGIGAGPASPDA
jgi:hypothetical protein